MMPGIAAVTRRGRIENAKNLLPTTATAQL